MDELDLKLLEPIFITYFIREKREKDFLASETAEFLHKSFQEYLLAELIIEPILSKDLILLMTLARAINGQDAEPLFFFIRGIAELLASEKFLKTRLGMYVTVSLLRNAGKKDLREVLRDSVKAVFIRGPKGEEIFDFVEGLVGFYGSSRH